MTQSSFFGDTPNYATNYPTQNDPSTNPATGNTQAPSSFYPNGGQYSQADPVAAAASASNAAASAAAALVSQNAAATSATGAGTSASSASTSATNAGNSATSAATSATNAANSATAASGSASSASSSASAASTSATNAANSATAASNSATTASTQAGNASTSASNASTSATNAATSATNAANAVQAAAGIATPQANGIAAVGTGTKWAHEDHVHPTDTTRAPLASPAFTGAPTAPTPTVGDNSLKLATTAFVMGNSVGALLASNNLSDVSSTAVAARNIAPTDLNLSGTPNGTTPRIASYTDGARLVFGREYLGAWINAWRTGAGPTSGIIMRGDSTMLGYSVGPTNTPQVLFTAMALRKGLRITTTQLAVGGASTADWKNTHLPSDLSTYTGANIPKLYILNYGMNDPYTGVTLTQAQTVANLRAGFALLRGTWSASQTSVVYMMPNTAYDDTGARNETWREQIVQQIKEACRDYGIMFFDTYAALREARYGLLTGWLNATDHVHPADDFNVAIWGMFTEALIGTDISHLGCQPLAVTPAAGYSLPGSAEDMKSTVSGDLVIGNGYINVTTPGAIAAGTTIATLHSYHTPITQAWGVQILAYTGSWQFAHAIITTSGVITTQEALTGSVSRIYFGPAVWKH